MLKYLSFRNLRVDYNYKNDGHSFAQILYKVWPSMNEFVRQLCKQSIEPSIVQTLTEYKIKGFQFDRLVLGRIVSSSLYSQTLSHADTRVLYILCLWSL